MVEGAAVAGALLAAVGRGTWAAAGGTGQGEAAMALAAAAGAAQAAEGAWLQSAGEKVKAMPVCILQEVCSMDTCRPPDVMQRARMHRQQQTGLRSAECAAHGCMHTT